MTGFSVNKITPPGSVPQADGIGPAVSTPQSVNPGDRIEISQEAMARYEAEQLLQIVRESPDIRAAKVERIMNAIVEDEEAYYNSVSDEQLADAILRNPFSDFNKGSTDKSGI